MGDRAPQARAGTGQGRSLRLRSRRLERFVISALRIVLVGLRDARTLGAIAVLVRADGHVLLVRSRYRVDWGLPGGFLRRGEVPEDAVRRELTEELGLALTGWERPVFRFQPDRRHVDFIFRRDVTESEVDRISATSLEITSAAWFPLSSLPPLQPEAEAALEMVGLSGVSSR